MAYLGVKPAGITSATQAEIAGDLTVDTNTLKVDATNNRVGVGTASPSQTLETAGNIFINSSGNPSLEIKTSGAGNNPFLRFKADTNYWDAAAIFSNSGDDLFLQYNGSTKVGFPSAGGLTFNGDTATANALDDYEEGTWTPAVSTGSGVIDSSAGYYTKVGNQVTVYGQFRVTTNFTSPAIAGLPYTVRNVFSLSIFSATGAVMTAGLSNGHFIACAATEGSTTISLRDGSDVNDNHLPNTTQSVYRLSLTYQTS